MLNLKKITTTVSLLSLGALSVALFSTGCDDGTNNNGTGGAGGKSSTGGQGGQGGRVGSGGAAGGHGGSASGGAAGGHGGSATGGAVGGHGGSATGGAAGGHGGSAIGGAAGGHGGSATGGAGGAGGAATGGATGGNGGSESGGAGGSAHGGTAGTAAGGSAGGAGGQANIMYNVALTGAMEVLTSSQTASTATGSATVILNPNTGAVSVQGSFTGLTTAASSAHIHGPAPVGMNANVIVPLTASPATAGAVSGSGTLTTQQVADMKNGLTYINVHSSGAYAGGEIRGQIQ